jgi:hypothetical protein
VAAPVFKTGGAALDVARWVRLPCAPATFRWPVAMSQPRPRTGQPQPRTGQPQPHTGQPLVVRWTAEWGDFVTLRGLQVLVPLGVGAVLVAPWLLQLAGIELADDATIFVMQGLGLIMLLFGVLVTARFLRFVMRSVGTAVTWTVGPAGVRVRTDRGRDTRYGWPSLRSVTDRGRAVEVQIEKGPRLRVPKRALPSTAAVEAFLETLQRSIDDAHRDQGRT